MLKDPPLGHWLGGRGAQIIGWPAKEDTQVNWRLGLLFFLVATLVHGVYAQEGPNRPQPRPLTLDSKTTATLVLDLNARSDDPKQVCSKITAPLGDFLEKARATAARMYRYKVVIPMDGVNANTHYEHEYSLHQFTVLPSNANKQFQFTNLSMITFH